MTDPNLTHEAPAPKAFILSDFTFYSTSQARIYNPIESDISIIDYVDIRWRFQKNRDNGQVIPFKRDNDHPSVCPVLAAFRIHLRAKRLKSPISSPIAIYASSKAKHQRRYITASQVRDYLQQAARVVFNLHKKEDLRKWTTHSIRVTAANILHRAGMSDSYIQTRLRWKSQTFLMYLRNSFYSAQQHNSAMEISNRNLPQLPTHDGLRYRPLEPHEEFIRNSKILPNL